MFGSAVRGGMFKSSKQPHKRHSIYSFCVFVHDCLFCVLCEKTINTTTYTEISMNDYVTLGIPADVKKRLQKFKYRLEVDSFGEAITKLMDYYDKKEKE